MRFACFSDTHSYHNKLTYPEADTLLFGGDWTRGASKLPAETLHFADFVAKLPYKHKIVIAGNHDWYARVEPEASRKAFEDRGIVFLCDSGFRVTGEGESFLIWGAPWTPKFYNWAFMRTRNSPELKAAWELVPENTDILMTHGPAHGFLDRARDGRDCGCELLAAELERIKPKVHLFGHIHEGYGARKYKDTHFINASAWNHYQDTFNRPVVFELKAGEVTFL